MPDRVGEEGCVEGATTKCERLTAIADEQGWRPMADVSHPHIRRIAETGAASGAMGALERPPAGISAASAQHAPWRADWRAETGAATLGTALRPATTEANHSR